MKVAEREPTMFLCSTRILFLSIPLLVLANARADSNVPPASAKGTPPTVSRGPTATRAMPRREHTLKLLGAVRADAPKTVSVSDLEATDLTFAKIRTSFKDETPAVFEGVLLKDLARKFGSPGAKKVRVVAVNAYEQVLPLEGWKGPEVLLAYKQNGEVIAPSKRGTFRLVMDLKGQSALQRETLYPYFVWSVGALEFLP